MKLTSSTHNHTTLCDGANTPEEMAAAALAAGFTDFGFSGHTYVPCEDFGVKDEAAYTARLRALARRYEGRMNIAVGLEHDFYFPVRDRSALDYIIGSVHMLRDDATGRLYAVDSTRQELELCRAQAFGGDGLAMARRFFALTAENVRRYRPEIVGHFDLIVKNNADGGLFDEEAPAYREAALDALRVCAATGAIFEVNTGGVFRGYRAGPYPARFLLEELRRLGARVTVNADAHCTGAIAFQFPEMLALLRDIGFKAVTVLENGAFVEKPLDG